MVAAAMKQCKMLVILDVWSRISSLCYHLMQKDSQSAVSE